MYDPRLPPVTLGRGSYWLTRFVVLRLLGLVYLMAFLTLVRQGPALLGHHGLTPVDAFLARAAAHYGSRADAAFRIPSLFWLDASDRALLAVGWAGAGTALLVLAGFANALMLAALWALHLSVVHVGQVWYGFGWEIQLLETGFLAIFLCPLLDGRPFPRRPPPTVVLWCLRWLTFRIMLGAGLIKIRGDSCWRDLTCLDYHYETQPIPNPLSWWLHFRPHWFQRVGVVFNHVAELGAPWFVFGPCVARRLAGGVLLLFQLFLIASGNLAYLNWLTIVPILACFDDALLARVLPRRLVARAERAAAAARPSRPQQAAAGALLVVVAVLSVNPVANLLSTHQVMNTSFDVLSLVNTYGAFGSVGRARPEIVFEGTRDPDPGPDGEWRAYEFRCKPGDPARRPCVVSPYHLRLDWLVWFAAMSSPQQYPWTVHLAWKLLHGDPGALGLLANDPFPGAPPRWIRARLYRYEFAPPGTPGRPWWKRTLVREWLPPLSVDDERLHRFLAANGWAAGGPP